MSDEKNRAEARRWLDQSVEDLKAARVLRDGERYAQACFYSQQAAEKALKSLGWLRGAGLWGHSLLSLYDRLRELGVTASIDEGDLALLDRFYIPTRYPNGLPDVIPQRAFLLRDAQSAVETAKRVIEIVRANLC